MSPQQTAKKDQSTLESLVLSSEDIKKYQLSAADLYYFSLEGKEWGPIYKEALKQNLEFFDPKGNSKIRLANDETWVSPYQHPYFQRRRLNIVDNQISGDSENGIYFLDKFGLKNGPHSLAQIESMLEDKSLLLTNLVSLDQGKSWLKLYQIEQFDRRQRPSQAELPELPQTNFLERPELKVVDETMVQTEDAIVGLAIINNINTNKAQDKAYSEVIADSVKKQSKSSNKTLPLVLVIITAMVSAVWFFSSNTTREEGLTNSTTLKVAPITAPPVRALPPKRTPAATKPQNLTGNSKVTNRINPALPNTKSYQKKAFKDSEAYEIRNDINETAVQGDFVEGEIVMPEAQLSDEELMELESKISKRFNITPTEPSEGPSSEDGLFDEETSY